MARASDGPASSADLGWRRNVLTVFLNYRTHNVGYWSGEGFRVNGNRTQSYPGAEHNVVSLVKVKVSGRGNASWAYLKTCDREPGIIFQKEIACGIHSL